MKSKARYIVGNGAIDSMIDRYISDVLDLEKKNLKLQVKIDRVVRGSRKHHKEVETKYKSEMSKKNQTIERLEKENEELKLGISFRNDLLNQIKKENKDPELKLFIERIWNETLDL